MSFTLYSMFDISTATLSDITTLMWDVLHIYCVFYLFIADSVWSNFLSFSPPNIFKVTRFISAFLVATFISIFAITYLTICVFFRLISFLHPTIFSKFTLFSPEYIFSHLDHFICAKFWRALRDSLIFWNFGVILKAYPAGTFRSEN